LAGFQVTGFVLKVQALHAIETNLGKLPLGISSFQAIDP
jgi:hypothetical protein